MQILGSSPDWCICICSAMLDQGQTLLQLFNLCILSSATTALSTLWQGKLYVHIYIGIYRGVSLSFEVGGRVLVVE